MATKLKPDRRRDLRTMRFLQRALSNLFNLFFRDLREPTRLWPWWQLFLYGGAVALCFVALSRLG